MKSMERSFWYDQHCKKKYSRKKANFFQEANVRMHEKYDEWDWWFEQRKPWPMTRKDAYEQLTFDIVHRKRSLAGNAFKCSRMRSYTNDMLMFATRGINGGTS